MSKTELTNTDLENLLRLEEAATSAPWTYEGFWIGIQIDLFERPMKLATIIRNIDGEFIAAARNHIRPLVEEVKRLRGEENEWCNTCGYSHKPVGKFCPNCQDGAEGMDERDRELASLRRFRDHCEKEHGKDE